jgi:L-fuculose-phosphate aldolase
MIAAFGGPEIRCADYAGFGTEALSAAVVAAMEGRAGCLMANHGMLVGGPTLARALWLAEELEALAHQHYHALLLGGGHILTDAEVAEAARGFAGYGLR